MLRNFIVVLLFLPAVGLSQQRDGKKYRFRSIVSAGLILGESEANPLLQYSAGFAGERYFAGIGAGYDPYLFNSIPVFLDGRVNIGFEKNLFAYGMIGYNFPGKYDREDEVLEISDRMNGGIFLDAGIGYRIAAGKSHHLYVSAGYSHKENRRVQRFSGFCTGVFPCSDPVYILRSLYRYDRIIIKAGWEFGK
jgi:hypothetical protein